MIQHWILWTVFDTTEGSFDTTMNCISTKNLNTRYQISCICTGNLCLVLFFALYDSNVPNPGIKIGFFQYQKAN